jgi:hypothetical protein
MYNDTEERIGNIFYKRFCEESVQASKIDEHPFNHPLGYTMYLYVVPVFIDQINQIKDKRNLIEFMDGLCLNANLCVLERDVPRSIGNRIVISRLLITREAFLKQEFMDQAFRLCRFIKEKMLKEFRKEWTNER